MLIPFQAFIFYEWSLHCKPIPVFITAIPAMRTGFPVMKTGFSLWEKLQREIPVFITGMRFASVILLHYFCFKNSCRLKIPQMFSQQRAKFYRRNKKKLSLYKSNNTNILEKNFFTKSSVRIQKLKCDTRIAIFHIVQSQLYSEMFF